MAVNFCSGYYQPLPKTKKRLNNFVPNYARNDVVKLSDTEERHQYAAKAIQREVPAITLAALWTAAVLLMGTAIHYQKNNAEAENVKMYNAVNTEKTIQIK